MNISDTHQEQIEKERTKHLDAINLAEKARRLLKNNDFNDVILKYLTYSIESAHIDLINTTDDKEIINIVNNKLRPCLFIDKHINNVLALGYSAKHSLDELESIIEQENN